MLRIHVAEVVCKEARVVQFESMFSTSHVLVHTKGHPFEVIAKNTVRSFYSQVGVDRADGWWVAGVLFAHPI